MKHKQSLCNLLFCFTFFLLVNTIRAQENPFPQDNPWGVYNWTVYQKLTDVDMDEIYKGGPIIVRWKDLEPKKNEFKFPEVIGKKLAQIPTGKYCFLMIYVAPGGELNDDLTIKDNYATPLWLLTETNEVGKVSIVKCSPQESPGDGSIRQLYFPHYMDADYKPALEKMINALGVYLKGLSATDKKKILYIQSAEGSTGDGAPYKGTPYYSGHVIQEADWLTFRKDVWQMYKDAWVANNVTIPILTNDDSNNEDLRDWMMNNLPGAIGVKNGMFSHGYQISDAQIRLDEHFKFRDRVTASGKVFYARGEQDAEYQKNGWSTKNIPQGLYWSSIYATHCGLSMWNVDTSALNGNDGNSLDQNNNIPAVSFFNKYAHEFYPQNAKGAFCAFYRGLDASNTTEFPVSVYGTAVKKNQDRYKSICKKFEAYGAKMEDAAAATGGGMENRKANGYNDAGWQILTTNFQRHLTQIEPETTSQAWWDVDSSIYGRFARSFTNVLYNNIMYFDLDDKFYSSQPTNGHSIVVRITYRDSDKGTWNFKCVTTNGVVTRKVVNSGTGVNIWKTETIEIPNAVLANKGPKRADFWLLNAGGTACRFHMIEVEKKVLSTSSTSARIGLKEGQANKIDDDFDVEANFTIKQDYLNNTIKVSSQNKLANISLFDLSGKQIQNHSCNNEEFVVDTNKMSSGLYIIVVTDQYGNHKNDKFIIK